MSSQRIKVACVGNSVTYGAGIKDRANNSYPVQLQKLLGDKYEVTNFGHSGATALKNGHKPYWVAPEFEQSKLFLPNIVIIHLGLNDQGMNNWPGHKEEFVNDYLELINTYKSLPTKPEVIICKMSPTFSGHHWFEEGMRESFQEIQSKIDLISKQANVNIINLHEPLYRFPEYFPDNLHPTKEGAAIIAKKAYSFITGDYGGLKIHDLLGENMVLQRNEPITISGISDVNDEIKVVFNNEVAEAKVGRNGTWKITLASMKAGGPYTLTIKSKISEDILINQVFIGEVWLASGQSNMAFETRGILHAEPVLNDSINKNIHLFSFEGTARRGNDVFSKEVLENCNAVSYFKPSGWQEANKENVGDFSAIAYAFAYNLQKKLNIPIGIIDNSVGGSPIQSWISRETMETTHETIDLLNDTHLNPMVQPWVSERKALNLRNKDKYGIKARHPFDPTMLFDAGINPIKDYNIKGVVWYQGESNAERVDFHSRLFKLLVQDWRLHWNKPEMPFYYVQLSSINRPTWGHFRDSQRRLLSEIPNTGMAVTSDVGNPEDVHPRRKWVVGERLSKVALAKSYHKAIPFSGPMLDYVNVKGNKLEVYFQYAEGLKTSNGEEVNDVLIAGAEKKFVSAQSKIVGDILEVWSTEVDNPRFVKYGYSPYTEANLTNKYGFPASTFSNVDN